MPETAGAPYPSPAEFLHDVETLARLLVERWDWNHFHITSLSVSDTAGAHDATVVGAEPRLEVLRELRSSSFRPHPFQRGVDDELRAHLAVMETRARTAHVTLPLWGLADLLRLDALGRRVLLFSAAAAVMPAVQELVRCMEERDGTRGLTVGKVISAAALGRTERIAALRWLGNEGPLLGWGLLTRAHAPGGGLLDEQVLLPAWVVAHIGRPDAVVAARVTPVAVEPAWTPPAAASDLEGWVPCPSEGLLAWLSGEPARAEAVARAWAESAGRDLHRLRLSETPSLGPDLRHIDREAILDGLVLGLRQDLVQLCAHSGVAVLLDGLDRWGSEPSLVTRLFQALRDAQGLATVPILVVDGHARRAPRTGLWDMPLRHVRLRPFTPAESLARWEAALRARGVATPTQGLGPIASRYGLTDAEVDVVAASAVQLARSTGEARGARSVDATHVQRAATSLTTSRLGSLAEPVRGDFGWDDLVLPPVVLEKLQDITRLYRHGEALRREWGFDRQLLRTQGLSALFTGPPGTGKTLSATVIANDLGLEAYRVDLARVVSKWVGETEKNLAHLFDAAERARCVLLFDEADSLFSTRTEVKSSQDRHSNMEVSYLLQRIETYQGIAILTSNMQASIDSAFQRRLNSLVVFPFPDRNNRLALWKTLMPRDAPTSTDIDYDWLADNVELAGGHLRNVLIHAAVRAVDAGRPLDMALIYNACQAVLHSMGKLPLRARPSILETDDLD